MAFEGQNNCAVHECGRPCSDGANLCQDHYIPGVVIELQNGTCVVTVWFAERAKQAGVIVMNDYELGDLFGGAAGFKAQLERQGFSDVRNLSTFKDLEEANIRVARAPGNWAGPWSEQYPWEWN